MAEATATETKKTITLDSLSRTTIPQENVEYAHIKVAFGSKASTSIPARTRAAELSDYKEVGIYATVGLITIDFGSIQVDILLTTLNKRGVNYYTNKPSNDYFANNMQTVNK
jgi:hypothetical protein